ncbi:uncharacterized protein [Hoplias malabaricus]|uniref:uncharacterized protein n=1 Tax=Hoplias malabaricus TaxID=27720 RepID=UPI003461D28F
MFLRCRTVMESVGFLSLLVCGIIHSVHSETLHVTQTEGNIAVLKCGTLTKGTVTWSRDIDGQRVDILTNHNGETTKHISDPDKRYSSGGNLWLSIFRVSQSDAGRYYCSGTTVELTVKPRNTTTTATTSTIKTTTTRAPTTTKATNTVAREVSSPKTTEAAVLCHSSEAKFSATTETTSTKVTEMSTRANTHTTQRTATTEKNASNTTKDLPSATQELWIFMIILLGSCLTAVPLVLFLWRCLYKRKAPTSLHNPGHVYDSITDVTPVTLSMDQRRTGDPVYYLASNSDQTSVDQRRTGDPVYYLATNSVQTSGSSLTASRCLLK